MGTQNQSPKKYPFAGSLIVIGCFFILIRACNGCDNSTENTQTESHAPVTNSNNRQHYFDANGNEVTKDGQPLPKAGEKTTIDTTSSEYIVTKLSNKKHLTKSEKELLRYAKEDIIATKANDIAEKRYEEINRLKADFADHCLSQWDGACSGLVAYVKDRMNNPSSFEHVETRYSIQGDYAVLIMKYRGTNAFGAVVTNYITAKVNSNCEVLEVLDNE